MEWYKSHSSLRKNPIYKRLSPLARQAFRNAMDAVADYEQGDKLALRIGKLTTKELAEDLLVPVKSLQKVLQELSDCEFFTADSDGIWHIAKFTEKTESHAERQRRYREKKKKRDAQRDATSDGNAVTLQGDDNGVASQRDGYRSRDQKEEDTNVSGDVSPSQPPLGVEKPSDLAAWRILDAAWPVISGQHDLAINRTDWRKHNARAARALANNGKTAEDVAEMLELAYGSKFYAGITTLAKLIEHWPKIAALDEPDEEERRKAYARGDFLPRV